MSTTPLERLHAILGGLDRVRVAVSGGVDSMTLGVVAHRLLERRAHICHAVSAAVPAEATERVHRYAARHGWRLSLLDAGELEDASYRANPLNRCFHCKTNLYATMMRHGQGTLISGTNLDDLNDFRPGLVAAEAYGVRHPYVEAGLDKAAVRRLARSLALVDLADLPASPCLSSRIETGIPIDVATLGAVYRSERLVARRLGAHIVRCRVRHDRIVVELDPKTLGRSLGGHRDRLVLEIGRQFAATGRCPPVEFQRYRMGSAFVAAPTDA